MAIDYGALGTEIQTDPNVYGYAPLVATGNDQGIADLLNLPRVGITVNRNDVRRAEVIGALVVSDYDALTAARRDLLSTMLMLDTLDLTDPDLLNNFAAIFGGGTTTRANLIAIGQRDGSRAEQLFGTGTRITHLDVARALGRG